MRFYLILILFSTFCYSQNLQELRKNLAVASENKSICQNMIKSISENDNNPIHIAYLGAYQTIWANHVINPANKLSTFRKGKNNIEKAISMNQTSLEIRLVRYAIQKNAPKFLGYHHEREADRKYIEKHRSDVKSVELKELIKSVL